VENIVVQYVEAGNFWNGPRTGHKCIETTRGLYYHL